MSDEKPSVPPVAELRVSAHLMQLDAGVYCVFNSPGAQPADPQSGLPGARLTPAPGHAGAHVTIRGLREDGWLAAPDGAALVRVAGGPAQVLMTIYQSSDGQHEPPRIQVTKLVDGASLPPGPDATAVPTGPAERPAAASAEPGSPAGAEIAAHLQGRGDVLGRMGEWIGQRGNQRWVEGFSLSPHHPVVGPDEIEYQAVLGRGWLSPWCEGGQFCGSRGMALPILGLRARLRGKAAETHTLEVSATFTDGTAVGPVGPGDACEADSLAPLEAFQVKIVGLSRSSEPLPAPKPSGAKRKAKAPAAAEKEPPAPPSRRRRS